MAFIERAKVKYPFEVDQTYGPLIRPQLVEAFFGHSRLAHVPLNDKVVWLFQTQEDADRFKEHFL
jgi:hypothetical protein